MPFPPQYEHVSGEEPGLEPFPLHVPHFSVVENFMSCFLPWKASSREIDKSYLKSDPLLLVLLLLDLPPPPKSPKKSSKISEKSAPLKPPKPPPGHRVLGL